MYAGFLIILVALMAAFIGLAQPTPKDEVVRHLDQNITSIDCGTVRCNVATIQGSMTGALPVSGVFNSAASANCPDGYTLLADRDGKPKCAKDVIDPVYK